MNRRRTASAAAAAAAAALLAFAPAASAGKASIALVEPSAAATTTSLYTSGATFAISQNRTAEPWVRVNCVVNGVLAYSQLLGYFPSWQFGQTFYFTSNYLEWNYYGLPLNCRAMLESIDARGAEHVLASTSFVVQP